MSKEHPVSHYDFGGLISPFEVFRLWGDNDKMTSVEAFHRFNVLKYLWRYKHKNGIEDLEKAQDYLRLLIDEVKMNE